jgi:D-alanyl-D-alanine carboxypeptidase (penicillin-binding protein 5/6)
VGSVKQGDRRVIFAFSGTSSISERAEEAERISSWAFRQFSLKTVAKGGVAVAEATVFLGQANGVGLAPAQDVKMLVPVTARDGLKAQVIFSGPIAAPVVAGTVLGELVIQAPGLPDQHVPLVATANIEKSGPFGRFKAAASHIYQLIFGADEASA